jgi:hypothetical protein
MSRYSDQGGFLSLERSTAAPHHPHSLAITAASTAAAAAGSVGGGDLRNVIIPHHNICDDKFKSVRPAWQLDPADIFYEAEPFNEGFFGTVYRAKWREMLVCAKKLKNVSNDEMRRPSPSPLTPFFFFFLRSTPHPHPHPPLPFLFSLLLPSLLTNNKMLLYIHIFIFFCKYV